MHWRSGLGHRPVGNRNVKWENQSRSPRVWTGPVGWAVWKSLVAPGPSRHVALPQQTNSRPHTRTVAVCLLL